MYWEPLRPIGALHTNWGHTDGLGPHRQTRAPSTHWESPNWLGPLRSTGARQRYWEPLRPTGAFRFVNQLGLRTPAGTPQPDWDPADLLGAAQTDWDLLRPIGAPQMYWEPLIPTGILLDLLGSRRCTGSRSDRQATSQPNWGPAARLGPADLLGDTKTGWGPADLLGAAQTDKQSLSPTWNPQTYWETLRPAGVPHTSWAPQTYWETTGWGPADLLGAAQTDKQSRSPTWNHLDLEPTGRR